MMLSESGQIKTLHVFIHIKFRKCKLTSLAEGRLAVVCQHPGVEAKIDFKEEEKKCNANVLLYASYSSHVHLKWILFIVYILYCNKFDKKGIIKKMKRHPLTGKNISNI